MQNLITMAILLIYFGIHLMFCGWAIMEGEREAYYYHYSSQVMEPQKNLHSLFLQQRFVVIILISMAVPHILFYCTFLSCAFMFSYFHNGSYYSKRNDLNPDIYPIRWKDHKDSIAKFDFTYKSRFIQFWIGIAIFVGSIIFLSIHE